MSKTDKTRPFWVKTLDYYEKSRYVEHDHRPKWGYGRTADGKYYKRHLETDVTCDFDPQASTLYSRGGQSYRDHDIRCGWTIPYYYSWNHWHYRPPTSEDRHRYYYDKERAAVRVSNREMAKDWNANGDDFDDDIAIADQHRHSSYRGGWWD